VQQDLRVNSANLLARFEDHLRSDPGQWAVLEPVWADDATASQIR
jgi:hypothetical protein